MIESVRVCSQTYKVCVEEPWIEDQYGGCDTKGGRIWIAEGLSVERQEQVLVHEIVEALNFELDLELEHHTITLLEMGLYGVLKDNPKLLEGVKPCRT